MAEPLVDATDAEQVSAELAPSQQVVDVFRGLVAAAGGTLQPESRILDFGCGTGRHTYEFIDRGFSNVVGFDQLDYLDLRDEADRARFHFAPAGDPLPFEDASLDFVVSTSVFEHVVQPRPVIAEIARVLAPGGFTVHVFPSKWRPLEPHIFVPFGGGVQTRAWHRLWASLGVRNIHQAGMSTAEVVEANQRYCREGLAYWSAKELGAMWRDGFDDLRFLEPAFVEATRAVSGVSALMSKVLRIFPPALAGYRHFHTRVVVARKMV